jgi:hypothetical protein
VSDVNSSIDAQKGDESRVPCSESETLPPGESITTDDKSAAKPRWQRFLESSGGTALITVLIGGLFGQYITASIQQKLKEREFQQSWLQTQGSQATTYYKEYLTEEQSVVRGAYEVVGTCISASEDLVILTRTEFDLRTYSGKAQQIVRKQKEDIRDRFNRCDDHWRDEREKWGLLMSFYHRGRPEIGQAWTAVRDDLTDFMACAREWNLSHLEPVSVDLARSACREAKAKVRVDLIGLSKALDATRSYAWEGWESPEKLKALLEK